MSVVVHGDDLTALGADVDLDWYTAELETCFEIKVRGRIGEGTTESEIRILNRIVRVVPEGIRYPRHHELLSKSLGVETSTHCLEEATAYRAKKARGNPWC